MNRHTLAPAAMAALALAQVAPAADTVVRNDAELAAARENARPGDTIVLAPGDYGTLSWNKEGAREKRIVVRRMTRSEYEKTKGPLRDESALEVRALRLAIGGAHTTIDGVRVTGAPDVRGAADVTGHHIRLTNVVFDDCRSGRWLALQDTAYECEIDHCLFANKLNNAEKHSRMQVIRILTRAHAWPAGHVLHHNLFVNIPRGKGRNNYETIQIFNFPAVGKPGPVPERTWEENHAEDVLVALNRFEKCDGEDELISIKASNVFMLLNTLAGNRGSFVLRTGRCNTVEGNFVFGGGSFRITKEFQLIRSNYCVDSPIWLNCTRRGRQAVEDSWILNNTNVGRSALWLDWRTDDKSYPFKNIQYLNNVYSPGDAPEEKKEGEKEDFWAKRAVLRGVYRPNDTWDVRGNMYQGVDLGDDPEKKRFTTEKAKRGFRKLGDLGFVKDAETSREFSLWRPGEGSPVLGAAAESIFLGGLDPFGNPVPASGANAGAFQKRTHDLFRPLTKEDVGPRTQKGEAPAVRITSPRGTPPEDRPEIAGKVKVSVEATDADGEVAYVYLTLNNQPVSVDAEAPYEWKLDRMLLKGLNRVRAVAFDDRGNLSFDTVYVTNTSESSWPRRSKNEYENFGKKR